MSRIFKIKRVYKVSGLRTKMGRYGKTTRMRTEVFDSKEKAERYKKFMEESY